jgi:hypothetical protein
MTLYIAWKAIKDFDLEYKTHFRTQDKLTIGKYKWRAINQFLAGTEILLFTIESILALDLQSPQQLVRTKGSVILGKMAAS